MDLATGARTRLLEGSSILTVPGWTKDMARLVVIEDHSSADSRLWIMDAATGVTRALPRTAPARFASVRWVEKGAALMGLSDAGADMMRLCRIDPETGASTVVFEAEGRDVEAWSLSPDETMLATIENDRGYAVLRVGRAGQRAACCRRLARRHCRRSQLGAGQCGAGLHRRGSDHAARHLAVAQRRGCTDPVAKIRWPLPASIVTA